MQLKPNRIATFKLVAHMPYTLPIPYSLFDYDRNTKEEN